MRNENRFALEAAALGAFRRLARIVPRKAFIRAGRAMGALVAAADTKHRDIAKDNLRRSFPD